MSKILNEVVVPFITMTEDLRHMTLPPADLIIDAVTGYSLSGVPTGPAADLIRAANAHGVPILSLDVPSGIDTTTGSVFEPAIQVTATSTLAFPKEGLRTEATSTSVNCTWQTSACRRSSTADLLSTQGLIEAS